MFKHTRAGLLVALALMFSLLLAACGPSSATDTPAPAANTTAAATTAAAAAATTAAGAATTAAATTAAAGATTAAAAGSGGADIHIGLMAPLTGGSQTLGTAIKRGVDMAVEEINAAGGINGRKIVTIERDDKADPETGINNVRDLIDKEKVTALIGTANTAVGTKQAPIVNQGKTPWVIPVTTGTVITHDTTSTPSYVFRVSMRDDEQTPFVAAYMVDQLKAKKIALLHDSSGYGTLGRDDLLKAFSDKGVTPIMVEQFQLNDAADNFKPLLTKVKQAGADAVVMWCLGADAANVKKAMKDLGMDNVPVVGSWGLSMPPFPDNANGLEEGTIVPQTISVDTTNPKQQAFFDKYKKKYNVDRVGFPSGLTQSYDAMYMLAQALKAPGAADSRDKLRDALENLGTYDGVIKKYENPFKNQFHEAFTRADFFLTVWKQGKMVKLDTK